MGPKNALNDDPSIVVAGRGVQKAIETGELSVSKPGRATGTWGFLDELGSTALGIAGQAATLALNRAIAPKPESGPQHAVDLSYAPEGAAALQDTSPRNGFQMNSDTLILFAALAVGAYLISR